MAARTTLSLDQFLALPEREEDGTTYELSDGELIRLSPPGYRHALIITNIATLLRTRLDRARFVVATGDAGFLLKPKPEAATVRGADVAVNRRGTPVPAGLFPGSPFVAIEVVSPSNTPEYMDRKIKQYLAAGSEEVWILYPDTLEVHVYSQDQQPLMFREDDEFESVLGCRFRAGDFFEI
ncbi:MAG: Uma2 family endonuclease [Acidobacteriaceae bacterium]|nr:Uma2 family endonuclease [Acidobacteriaceae bacterium]MBV8569658.1 Uma2 family endonuclease [Acidobacteriaceae bacterium]